MIADHELMLIEAETNFTYDARGRMLLTNEPLASARRPAPQLWLGTTSAGDVIVRMGAALLAPPLTCVYRGPAYTFKERVSSPPEVVPLSPQTRQLARDTFPWLLEEVADWQPCFAVVRDGAAVSVCYSSRIGPRACAAGVDTLPDFRGRGYATLVTAAWANAVRASGKIPLYGTTWDNLASQGVARRLGLRQFGSTESFS